MPAPDLVHGFPIADAAAVLALGVPRELAPGAVLFRLGDPADAVYLIRSGRVSLTLPMRLAGREQDVVVEEYEPGHTLGWSALIPPHRFTLTATAPLATSLLEFDRERLMAFCAAHPAIGYSLALNIAAVVGARLQVFQAMWLREMQRTVDNAHA